MPLWDKSFRGISRNTPFDDGIRTCLIIFTTFFETQQPKQNIVTYYKNNSRNLIVDIILISVKLSLDTNPAGIKYIY